jgi:hypothetical protein
MEALKPAEFYYNAGRKRKNGPILFKLSRIEEEHESDRR